MAAERLQLSLAKFRTVFQSLGLATVSAKAVYLRWRQQFIRVFVDAFTLQFIIFALKIEDRGSSPLAVSLSSRWLGTFTPLGAHPPTVLTSCLGSGVKPGSVLPFTHTLPDYGRLTM
ncbi:hypothetical protein BJ165DRAFT_1535517 [Panaeolus papilionaceus]|nr:hypothetical protein BJ165DRAFT_1535517 [Panaeolus papilionaceus]